MSKIYKILNIAKGLFFLLIMSVSLHVFAESTPNWSVDKYMRFHITYLPDDNSKFVIKKGEEIVPIPMLNSPYSPDVSDINLLNFLALGFDLPKPLDAEEYTLYLKLYHFPKQLNSDYLIQQFFDEYCLNTLPNASELKKYLQNKDNLVLKNSFEAKIGEKFGASHPIPQLVVSSSKDFERYLAQHIPFYSLYLLPSGPQPQLITQDDMAQYSTEGVENFYQDLLKGYKSELKALKGRDNYYYFLGKNVADKNKNIANEGRISGSAQIDPSSLEFTRGGEERATGAYKDIRDCRERQSQQSGKPKCEGYIAVLKVPKQIWVLKEWRELAMPEDPRNIFLSSLLSIYYTEYKANSGSIPSSIPVIDSSEFRAAFTKVRTKILEVGSAVYLQKMAEELPK